jgi:hypothetical protein
MREDSLIQYDGLLRLPRKTHHRKYVGESLYAETDRSVSHIGSLGFGNRIIIDINHAIQILDDRIGDFAELLEIESAVLDECGKSQRL